MSVKLLLDTDIGTDIDDAICLTYLLANPDCDLLGITTVTGEVEKRAMIASAICKHMGKEVPIYPGADNPLVINQLQKYAQQAEALGKWEYDKKFPKGEAIEFMRRTIRDNPGEITLLSVGPLTNVGLLFAVDPEIPALLKGLVMMCGYFKMQIPEINNPLEWNAMGDYHATNIVYKAQVAIHRSIGLDVTAKVQMPANEFEVVFKNEMFRPVLDFAKIWFEKFYAHVTFHDPLAAAVIFDPEICEFERGNTLIELYKTKYRGMTKWRTNPGGMHEAAVAVNKQRFFDHFMPMFK